MPVEIDFEARSALNLKDVGGYRWSMHPTTTAYCMAFHFDEEDEVHLWHQAFPYAYRVLKNKSKEWAPLAECRPAALDELFDRIARGDTIEAHNAFFERCMWTNVMVPRHGWPEIKPEQWRCSAAKAASFGLPRNLEGAILALGLDEEKDMVGNKLSVKLAKPRKPIAAEWRKWGECESAEEFTKKFGLMWHENREELDHVLQYCKQDVRGEHALSQNLRDLSDEELRVWQLDQEMNWRGLHCDRAGIERALELVEHEVEAANLELMGLTGGMVSSSTKRNEILAWSDLVGVGLPNTRAETLDRFVQKPELDDDHRQALEIIRATNKTSTKKYASMRDRMNADDRMRDLLMYWGAHTGRWTGRGVQPHNFPQGFGLSMMAGIWDDLMALDAEELTLLYGPVMEVLSAALRGALCAPDGRSLMIDDFSAIEARGTFWIADDQDALEIFKRGECIYRDLAGDIFGLAPSVAQALAKDSDERKLGKKGVLGLGYQMGSPKFSETCAADGIFIEDIFSKQVVDTYRKKFRKVKEFWGAIEAAAIQAVQQGRGSVVQQGRLRWAVVGRFLHCRLPSGRLLSYCDPKVELEPTPWDEMRPKLKFMGVDQKTRKWCRQTTYGGKLTENVVQALSRDLMAAAMLRIDAHPDYDLVLTVHDEIVAECDDDKGSIEEFDALMSELPEWADGFPIEVEGFRAKRYCK